MKKLLLLVLAVACSLPILAQTRGMVKREGGYTNVRSGPGTQYSVVRKIKDGSTIYYTNYNGSWCEVYSSPSQRSFIGYMASSKIVRGGGYDRDYDRGNYDRGQRRGGYRTAWVVDEDGYTNIRRGPGTQYSIVDRVRDGSYISVGGSERGWYRVYNSRGVLRGYISGNKIRFR